MNGWEAAASLGRCSSPMPRRCSFLARLIPETKMTRLTEAARGVYVIAVTPFEENGALDLESVDRMVDFYEEAGVDGLTVLGQLGEAPKLTAEESKLVVERVLK